MQNGTLRRLIAISCIAFFLSIIPPGFASATVGIGKSWGQTVYAA